MGRAGRHQRPEVRLHRTRSLRAHAGHLLGGGLRITLGQVSLLVTDVGRAQTFYGDVLGLPHLYTYGQLAFFDIDGVRLYLTAVEPDQWRASSILYFEVKDIAGAWRGLIEQGVSADREPAIIHRHDDGTEEWMAFFRDPDGNQLALMSRRPSPGTSASAKR